MKEQLALRHHEFGKADAVLRLEFIPQPEPGAGEVGVRLLAATINPSDYGRMDGRYKLHNVPVLFFIGYAAANSQVINWVNLRLDIKVNN